MGSSKPTFQSNGGDNPDQWQIGYGGNSWVLNPMVRTTLISVKLGLAAIHEFCCGGCCVTLFHPGENVIYVCIYWAELGHFDPKAELSKALLKFSSLSKCASKINSPQAWATEKWAWAHGELTWAKKAHELAWLIDKPKLSYIYGHMIRCMVKCKISPFLEPQL